VGIDVLLHTYGTLATALGPRMGGASDGWLRAMVSAKMLGRKTGRGYYLYEEEGKKGGKKGGEKRVNPAAVELVKLHRAEPGAPPPEAGIGALDDSALVGRMVARFQKECMHALQDGVVRSAADGDIGAVFGLGFPPFLGGPFRYADTVGARVLADQMQRLADAAGDRFAPPQILLDHARSGTKFYPDTK